MSKEAEAALRARVNGPFVVFAGPSLVIDTLEVPVDVPVTVGSQPSRAALASSDEQVLSIDDSGRLVAHRAGSVQVRSRSNESTLKVMVVVAEAIKAVPSEISARPLETVSIQVLLPTGGNVPSEAVVWTTSAPEVAVASNGMVYVKDVPGSALLTARYGGAASTVRITVGSPDVGTLHVAPAKPKMRLGSLLAFQARSHSGPVDALWSTSSEVAVAHLQDNLFQATAVGDAQVCARLGQRLACTRVEVTP
jgi:hypothetical protein